ELLGDPAASGAKVKVELTLEGRGRPSFLAVLRGFTADVKRHDTPELRIWRETALAPPPLFQGRPLPVGFTVLAAPPADAWENPVKQLALGGPAAPPPRPPRP